LLPQRLRSPFLRYPFRRRRLLSTSPKRRYKTGRYPALAVKHRETRRSGGKGRRLRVPRRNSGAFHFDTTASRADLSTFGMALPPGHPFTNFNYHPFQPPPDYWTSTTSAYHSDNVWWVNFYYGYMGGGVRRPNRRRAVAAEVIGENDDDIRLFGGGPAIVRLSRRAPPRRTPPARQLWPLEQGEGSG